MAYGAGGVGASSLKTLSKDLRARFSDEGDGDYFLNKNSYTIQEVATKARKFLFEESYLKAFARPTPRFRNGLPGMRILRRRAAPGEIGSFLSRAHSASSPTGYRHKRNLACVGPVKQRRLIASFWVLHQRCLDRLRTQGLYPAAGYRPDPFGTH